MSLKLEAIWAASPTTNRGQPTPLSSDAKGERITYASGKSIFVRSIDNPAVSKQYTGHTSNTTVARFSPSGYYIASGDASGSIRVWDCTSDDYSTTSTKGTYAILAGAIHDVAWDGDSQRIIAVGQGRERMGHCVSWDSGNTVGEIAGHAQQINCVSVRQQRPLRAATGSDDTTVGFFTGAPFRFATALRGRHERFVFGTAFSPDGAWLVSVGADKRIWVYDGKTGEAARQLGEGVHAGSIFGVAWAADSRRFVTASADQTVRVWEVESGKNTSTWRMGEEGVVSVPDQQVGVTWPAGRSDGLIISVDLQGNLNYLVEGQAKPIRVVRGHQKNVTAAALNGRTFFTGSYDGRVCSWDIKTGAAEAVDGDMHSNYVSGFAAETAQDRSYSVGWDDTLRCISAGTFTGSTLSVSGQPKAVAVSSKGVVYVATPDSIEIYQDGSKAGSIPAKGLTSIAASDTLLAAGHDDKSVQLYDIASNGTKPAPINKELRKATAAISTLAFSPTGAHLAAGVANGKILVYATADWSVATDRWSAHTARVTALAWDPTGEFAVSGSLDTNVYVWSLQDPGRRIKALNAHKDGVSGVAWLAAGGSASVGVVLSTGGDATVKKWSAEL